METTYASRLRQLDLPREVKNVDEASPDVEELARLAASFSQEDRSQNEPMTSASTALKTWRACNAAIYVENQVNVLVRGLLVYNEEDWQKQAMALMDSLEPTIEVFPALKQLRVIRSFGGRDRALYPVINRQYPGSNRPQTAAMVAGELVGSAWRAYSFTVADILRHLFPGKRECFKTRAEKFRKLIARARTLVWSSGVVRLGEWEWQARRAPIQWDTDQVDELDIIRPQIKAAWGPLGGDGCARNGFPDWFVAKLIRFEGHISEACDSGIRISEFPCVARWLARLR